MNNLNKEKYKNLFIENNIQYSKYMTETSTIFSIFMYFNLLDGFEYSREDYTHRKIIQIKNMRKFSKVRNEKILGLRFCKEFVESVHYNGLIEDDYSKLSDIGHIFKEELNNCFYGNIETMKAKYYLLRED